MMLLQTELERRLSTGELAFSGQVRKDSLLLTLGEYAQLTSSGSKVIDPYNSQSLGELYGKLITEWDQIELGPHQFFLISSAENLRLDDHHYAFMSTLSHIARIGLMSQPTSFFIDRGYEGHITFEIANLTSHTLLLYRSMPFAKLIIFRTDSLIHDSQNNISNHNFYYGKPNELQSRFCYEFSKPRQKGESNG